MAVLQIRTLSPPSTRLRSSENGLNGLKRIQRRSLLGSAGWVFSSPDSIPVQQSSIGGLSDQSTEPSLQTFCLFPRFCGSQQSHGSQGTEGRDHSMEPRGCPASQERLLQTPHHPQQEGQRLAFYLMVSEHPIQEGAQHTSQKPPALLSQCIF